MPEIHYKNDNNNRVIVSPLGRSSKEMAARGGKGADKKSLLQTKQRLLRAASAAAAVAHQSISIDSGFTAIVSKFHEDSLEFFTSYFRPEIDFLTANYFCCTHTVFSSVNTAKKTRKSCSNSLTTPSRI